MTVASLPQGGARPGQRLRWWRELLYVIAFYAVYSVIRNTGAANDSVTQAFRNARAVIRIERLIGLYHEETIQDLFLAQRGFIKFWDVFYGSAHFIITAAALVWMFRKMPDRYPLWRNTLAFTTALALFGYAFYPLMPPRLLPASYGYVDTLSKIGGLWSFNEGPVAKVSNQYAAMPSMHFGWAVWSALVFFPAARNRWMQACLVVYPFLTLFAIVVTANHFWLDAAGGAVALGAGYLLAKPFTRWTATRQSRQKMP